MTRAPHGLHSETRTPDRRLCTRRAARVRKAQLSRPCTFGTVLAISLAGCSGSTSPTTAEAPPVPTPIGVGPRFQPGPNSAALGKPRGGLKCALPAMPGGDVAHLELFAVRRVVLVPQGIGVAPPLKRGVQQIVSGRCRYPIATFDRTGTLDFTRSGLTLRDAFAVWGEPLSNTRFASFHAAPGTRVRAFVGGVQWRGDVGDVPLTHHAEIVLEVNGFVPPHHFFLFPR